MKIGIISDTHGNISATSRAAEIFKQQNVSAVFHCGDIGSFDVLSTLAGAEMPVHAVLGNVDSYSSDLKFFPTGIGVQLYGRFGEVALNGLRIALLHSDDRHHFSRIISSGAYDLVLSGHSHEVHDYMEGKTRCLNPGSAGRGEGTFALLDMDSEKFTVFNVN